MFTVIYNQFELSLNKLYLLSWFVWSVGRIWPTGRISCWSAELNIVDFGKCRPPYNNEFRPANLNSVQTYDQFSMLSEIIVYQWPKIKSTGFYLFVTSQSTWQNRKINITIVFSVTRRRIWGITGLLWTNSVCKNHLWRYVIRSASCTMLKFYPNSKWQGWPIESTSAIKTLDAGCVLFTFAWYRTINYNQLS